MATTKRQRRQPRQQQQDADIETVPLSCPRKPCLVMASQRQAWPDSAPFQC